MSILLSCQNIGAIQVGCVFLEVSLNWNAFCNIVESEIFIDGPPPVWRHNDDGVMGGKKCVGKLPAFRQVPAKH
jgi:hypothetical protein